MPTPNSPTDEMFDIHADPAFAKQFGANPSGQILGSTGMPIMAATDADTDINVGRTEQKIRIGAGLALVAAAAVAPVHPAWRVAFAGLGAMELITGSTRHCPMWTALGINTARGEQA